MFYVNAVNSQVSFDHPHSQVIPYAFASISTDLFSVTLLLGFTVTS